MFKAYPGKVVVHNMERGDQVSDGGILLGNDEGKTHGLRDRWAQVYAKGDDVTAFDVGDWILVRHGRWTRGIDFEDQHLYMVDYPDAVKCISKTIEMPDYISTSTHRKAGEFEFKPEDFTEYTGNKLY